MHRQDLQTSPNHENYCMEVILTIESFSVEINNQNIFKDIYQTTAALGASFVGKLLGRHHKLMQMLPEQPEHYLPHGAL